jgi:hypothetical protein
MPRSVVAAPAMCALCAPQVLPAEPVAQGEQKVGAPRLGGDRGGLMLRAALESPQVAAGAQTWTVLALRNESAGGPTFAATIPERNYLLDVLDQRGDSAPLTAHGERQRHAGGSRGTLPLDPGAERVDRILVSRLYDLTVDGTHTITAQRKSLAFPALGKEAIVVKSAAATLTIREPARLGGAEASVPHPPMHPTYIAAAEA